MKELKITIPSADGIEVAEQAATAAITLSLVVTTLGRTTEVEHLFHSLAAQSVADFEVIVVDQNDDDRLQPVLEMDWPFPVRRLHTPGERGASRGRNRGWRLGRGSVMLFPDDDCWYPCDFLKCSLAAMERWECDVLAGRAANEAGENINGRFEATAQRTNRTNVWTTAIEWVALFRREVLEQIDGFYEDVGVGAASPWQSCEIQDIIIRAIDAGFLCWFDPTIAGHHEEIVVGKPDRRMLRKARAYARGMGYVLRLHRYNALAIATWVVRPLGGGLLALVRGRGGMLPYYGQVALGRLEGALRQTFGT